MRKFDAVQVDQIWMCLSAFNFLVDGNEPVLLLKPMGTGVAARKFTWDQLTRGRVENGTDLVLQNGTRLVFYKLKPIELVKCPIHAPSTTQAK